MNAGFSVEFLFVGPLVGLLVARLFGRLTWPRALLASALGSATYVLLVLAIQDGMIGMPRRIYTAGAADSAFRLSWQEYVVAGFGSAVPGTIFGALLFGLSRLGTRIFRGLRGKEPARPS
jgi:hypothetical protein